MCYVLLCDAALARLTRGVKRLQAIESKGFVQFYRLYDIAGGFSGAQRLSFCSSVGC